MTPTVQRTVRRARGYFLTSFEMGNPNPQPLASEALFLGLARFENSLLHLPHKLEHGDDTDHDPGQRSSNGNQSDRFLLELIEAVAQPSQLAHHAVASVLFHAL